MEAFYITMIFFGVLLVIGALFFIAMDKVNGKDFFKEFDRKKEEMFNLIQESEEMVQELNRMSDYVVTIISEKNQEFFSKMNEYEASQNSQKQYSQANPQSVPAAGMPHMQNSAPYVPKGTVPVITVPGGTYYNAVNAAAKKVEIPAASEKAADDLSIHKANPEESNLVLKPEQTPDRPVQEVKKAEAPSPEKEIKAEKLLNTQYKVTEKTGIEMNNKRIVLDSRRREVLQMIEQGLSNDEIAVKLKIGKGEIGLIRGLSK